MSPLVPLRPGGEGPEPDHPRLQERPLSLAERRARWSVRAARWRAVEIAEAVFGQVRDSNLVALRPGGAPAGLLDLRVPFRDLDSHREREERFMAAVWQDPLLSHVPLVYVLGADPD